MGPSSSWSWRSRASDVWRWELFWFNFSLTAAAERRTERQKKKENFPTIKNTTTRVWSRRSHHILLRRFFFLFSLHTNSTCRGKITRRKTSRQSEWEWERISQWKIQLVYLKTSSWFVCDSDDPHSSFGVCETIKYPHHDGEGGRVDDAKAWICEKYIHPLSHMMFWVRRARARDLLPTKRAV